MPSAQAVNGKYAGCLGEEQGEKGRDGHGIKKTVAAVMKARHRGTSGNPAVLGVNDELTPRQQTADMQKSSHMSGRGGHPPLVHLCYFDSEGIKYTANT